MRLAHVIGKVTLSVSDPSLRGGRFVIAQPLTREKFAAPGHPMLPLAKGNSTVVYESLGAAEGQIIGFTEGAEAAAPFEKPTPVDAYAAAIIDTITYTPPAKTNS
ncbi:EutN/CcmL family microcompartment protein [Geminisphaera colitermitum]|uniref:EutN/CcmL family microcompartment protein n=1 Tax=Geminisphaera colitermitum TaxID=1148786 RepID=UPI0005BE11D7|nr:EutN/CcmL family microcompartment protein [Geminisphaera colitermitum]